MESADWADAINEALRRGLITQEQAIEKRYTYGLLNEEQTKAAEELAARGKIALQTQDQVQAQAERKTQHEATRQEAMQELASEVGPIESFLIGTGKGMATVGRGLGIIGEEDSTVTQALGALQQQRPYTYGAGEIVGEAAPFVPLSVATGGIGGLGLRTAASASVGALEGATISRGREEDILTGAATGAGIGAGAELLFPVMGKLGRKIYQKALGKAPRGSMLTSMGTPTPELKEALDAAGITFEELTADAQSVISGSRAGADPTQVARQTMFAEAGVPATRGEITQQFGQRATEQRLLESAEDLAAEPLRQFKLKQSEAVKENLRGLFTGDVTKEETGNLIQDALTGRKKLLRSQKNELYKEAADASEGIGGVQIFTDNIEDAIPNKATMRRLSRVQGNQVDALEDLLVEFGISKNEDAIEKFIMSGGEVMPLSINNVEEFRSALSALERADVTGSTKVATSGIKNALDSELDEMTQVVGTENLPAGILDTLKEARSTTRQLKTEFSPQSMIGRIIDAKKDGVTQITEASKVYDKLIGKAAPVEDVRKTMSSLVKSGEKGEQAIASLQASTIMDLIDAGFGTESRKISGVKTFNPTAFKRRLKNIGEDKLKSIFINNTNGLNKLKNIDKIASDLIPESGAVPKGSANVILDLMNKLGVVGISTKIPGGSLLVGSMEKIAKPVKTRAAVKKAVEAAPEVKQLEYFFDQSFPGIASALGISAITNNEEKINE